MRVFLLISGAEALRAVLRAACEEDDVVLCEATWEGAARRLVSLRVDAIIADEAPGADAGAMAGLRALAPATPILVLCDDGRLSSPAAFLRMGANACLEKPLDARVLRDALNHAAAAGSQPRAPEAPEVTDASRFSVGQHQMALRWLGRVSARGEDPARLAGDLCGFCADLFDTQRCYVLLETAGGVVSVHAAAGQTEPVAAGLRLRYTSGVMRWFEQHGCLIEVGQSPATPDAIQEMQLLQARLGAPLFRAGRVCGALLLGDKAMAPRYSRDECELLTLVARCVSVFFDKAREQVETRGRQRRLDAVLAHINTGVITVDTHETVTMMNQSAEKLLQLRAVEVLGRRVEVLPAAVAGAAASALAGGLPRVRQEIRDATLAQPLGLSVTPMGDDGVVVVFWPLPGEDEGAADGEGGAFWQYLAGRVAQEIKNPMVAISTFAQLLPQKYGAADFRENFSAVVQEEVARINRVVDQLAEFSQAPALRLETVDVNRIVRTVLDTFQPELREHGVALEAPGEDEPLPAKIDPIFFAQALHNVVRNAIEAMRGGGVLEVTAGRDGEAVEVRVRDSGGGLTREQAARAFLPFFSGKERGMGLGLPVARRILRAHGGALRLIESSEGGSCFALQIPIAREAHADHTGH